MPLLEHISAISERSVLLEEGIKYKGKPKIYLNKLTNVITGFVTRATRWVSLVKQELLTILVHPNSPPFPTCLSGMRAAHVKLHVFTFLVPWCDVQYDFNVKTMFA
jgi:hypothetical protein